MSRRSTAWTAAAIVAALVGLSPSPGGSGSTQGSEAHAAAPPGRYDLSVPGIAKDTKTGLHWVRNSGVSLKPAEAKAHCAGLALDGGGWRLPSTRAVATLFDAQEPYDTFDAVFPNLGTLIWTSDMTATTPGQSESPVAIERATGGWNWFNSTPQPVLCVR